MRGAEGADPRLGHLERGRRIGRHGDQLAGLAERPEARFQEGSDRRIGEVGDARPEPPKRAPEDHGAGRPVGLGRPGRPGDEPRDQHDTPGLRQAAGGRGHRAGNDEPPDAPASQIERAQSLDGIQGRRHGSPSLTPGSRPDNGDPQWSRPSNAAGRGAEPRLDGSQAPPGRWGGPKRSTSAQAPDLSKMMSSPRVR